MGKRKGIMIICAVILVLSFVGTASARTWYVDDDGGEDFIKIQDAVNVVNAKDTIIVKNGTYIENIVVNKRLTIRSENGPASTIVKAANSNDDVFAVTADYVTINGFFVKRGSSKSGILLYFADNCNISNNTCANNKYGITLAYSTKNSIYDNICLNNHMGISLLDSNNNSIFNNTCLENEVYGLYILLSSNNNILNNHLRDNKEGGISFLTSYNNCVLDNNCVNNEDGICISNSKNNIISINNCSNNRFGIFLFDSNNNKLTGNNASNNDEGIRLWYSDNNAITGNNVSNNNEEGIDFYDSSNNNTIYLNNFINNTDNVYSYDASTNIWNPPSKITYTYDGTTYESYLGNYWDDYNGTDAYGDGIGDTHYSIDSKSDESDDYPLMQPFENYNIPTSAHT
jgi:parallel beta-helix repeat protein